MIKSSKGLQHFSPRERTVTKQAKADTDIEVLRAELRREIADIRRRLVALERPRIATMVISPSRPVESGEHGHGSYRGKVSTS